MSFVERYGPWAVIAGASEGTGRAFAHKVASQGVNCILIARREAPLNALADELRTQYGVECATACIDLAAVDAADRVAAAVGTREIGLYVSNAGGDPYGVRFLDNDDQSWVDLLNRNVTTTVRCAHLFGAPMRARKRGGILLVGSGACYGGASFMAIYSASKAFEMCFAEGLWAELKAHDVDVLYYSLGPTDTPEFHRFMSVKGRPMPPNLASPDDVAEQGLARLSHGPVCNWGQGDDDAGYAPQSASARRARVLAVDSATKPIYGDG